MYQDPIKRMSNIHLWIGNVNSSENEYDEYFDQDDEICGFCIDIGEEEYDEDFIGAIPKYEKLLDVKDILEDTILSKEEYQKVISICEQKGLNKVNATFYYSDTELKPDIRKMYNGLHYIGLFKSEMA